MPGGGTLMNRSTWYDDCLVVILFYISYRGFLSLWAAFFLVGIALRSTAGRACSMSFHGALGGLPLAGFIILWSHLLARKVAMRRDKLNHMSQTVKEVSVATPGGA